MSKKKLADALIARKVNKDEVAGIISALEQCETGIFTNASLQENKEILLHQVKLILERIRSQLF